MASSRELTLARRLERFDASPVAITRLPQQLDERDGDAADQAGLGIACTTRRARTPLARPIKTLQTRSHRPPPDRPIMLRIRYTALMTLGEVFLESLTTGVITEREIAWIASRQDAFARHEEAVAIRLGRLVDEGAINLGCRLPTRLSRQGQQLAVCI